jgi:hypothetical protein
MAQPLRSPLATRLWVIVSLFVAVYLGARLYRLARPAARPDTSGLLERLAPLDLRGVLIDESNVDRGAFLTRTTKTRDELAAAEWGDETEANAAAWRGTVQMRHLSGLDLDPDDDVQPRGRMIWRFDRYIFFGDPELLEQISDVLVAPVDAVPYYRHASR